MKAYYTKTNRKKLINAYSAGDELICVLYEHSDKDFILTSSSGKILIFDSALVNIKQSKSTQGVAVMRQKKGHRVISAEEYKDGMFVNYSVYRAKIFRLQENFLPQAMKVVNNSSFNNIKYCEVCL